MRPKGRAGELEARRRRAVSLLGEGLGIREVARRVGSSPSSVKRWQEVVKEGGAEALAARPHPGRPSRLSAREKEKLLQLLVEGARAHGYTGELWTLPRVAQLIEEHFGVRYHPAHVWKILRRCGWSCQKPERRAKERNEEEIERWRREHWPHIKKARREGHSIVFLDESGFMLQPVVRRTWAPRGRTPIQWQSERHDRLSVISAISLSPRRCRLGLYWEIHRHNIRAEEVVRFLRSLRRHLRQRVVLILDRWSVHKAAAVRQFVELHSHTIRLEWLPSYAPDLNPVEQVWNHAKYTQLANVAPRDREELEPLVHSSIRRTRGQSHLLRSFFHTAKLPL